MNSSALLAMKDEIKTNHPTVNMRQSRQIYFGFEGDSSDVSRVSITRTGRKPQSHAKIIIFALQVGDKDYPCLGELQEGVTVINTSDSEQGRLNTWSSPKMEWDFYYRETNEKKLPATDGQAIFSFSLSQEHVDPDSIYQAVIRHRSTAPGTIVKIYNLNTQEYTKLGGLPQTHFKVLEDLSTPDREKLEETSLTIPTECIVAMKRDSQEEQTVKNILVKQDVTVIRRSPLEIVALGQQVVPYLKSWSPF